MVKKNSSSMNMQESQDYVTDLEDQLDAVYDIVYPDDSDDDDDRDADEYQEDTQDGRRLICSG